MNYVFPFFKIDVKIHLKHFPIAENCHYEYSFLNHAVKLWYLSGYNSHPEIVQLLCAVLYPLIYFLSPNCS